MTIIRSVLPCLGAALVMACASPPPAPLPASSEPVAATPAPEPAASVPSAPSAPVTPATQQQAQKIAVAAADLLEAGLEEQAKAELQRALAGDPNNKLAQNLMRQITADPVATLGRESFAYTVKPSDTLSRIASRFLGDLYAFYILARYNDIKVPRQVAGGQVIRIPGKAPPPGAPEVDPRRAAPAVASPPAVPAAPAAVVVPQQPVESNAGDAALASGEAFERRGNTDRAYADYQRALSLGFSSAAGSRAEALRGRLAVRYALLARSAFAKQDLDGAIRHWERVLQLDPGNDIARLEQSKAQALKEKVKSLK